MFDWLGLLANIVVVVAVLLLLWNWLRWRNWAWWKDVSFAKLVAALRLGGPIEVAFLLPKRQYHDKTFPVAGHEEKPVDSLTVGIGTYDLTVRIKANTEVTIEQIRLAIHETGGIGTRPIHRGIVPSRFLKHWTPDFQGRSRYVDWNGEVKVAEDFMAYPRLVNKGDHVLVTMRVRTQGDWDGAVAVILMIKGHFTRSQVVRLPLCVSRHGDEVPYLKTVPEPGVTLEARTIGEPSFYPSMLLVLGIANERPIPIEGATLNFRVPDWVGITPANQDGTPMANPRGHLLTASEVLKGRDGGGSGTGIKYWARSGMSFPGDIATLVMFRVDANQPAPLPALPVRVTIVSPDIDDSVSIEETVDWPV